MEKNLPVLDGFTGEQRVFLGWGQVWLDKAREDLRGQVANDPHSPAKFRINGCCRRNKTQSKRHRQLSLVTRFFMRKRTG
jgi:predicted metalloendopeptidase